MYLRCNWRKAIILQAHFRHFSVVVNSASAKRWYWYISQSCQSVWANGSGRLLYIRGQTCIHLVLLYCKCLLLWTGAMACWVIARCSRSTNARGFIMFVKVRFQGKCFLTSRALKIFWWWVCLHMSSQIWSIRKWLLTNRTKIRFLTGMGSQMTLKQPGTWKSFIADGTFMTQVMRKNVHGQCWHGYIHFPTYVTFLCIVRVQASMCLFMPTQVWAGGVIFATLRTCIFWLVAI